MMRRDRCALAMPTAGTWLAPGILAAISLFTLTPRSAGGQEVLWVGRLGTDTVVIEAARRTGSHITGTIVNVAAGLLVQRYAVALDPKGHVRSLRSWTVRDLSAPPADDEPPSLTIDIGDDSIRVTRVGQNGAVVTSVAAAEGVVPVFDAFFNNPMSLTDLALRQAVARGDGTLSLYYVGAEQIERLPLTRAAGSRVAFPYVLVRQYPMLAGAMLRARMDDAGLTEFDARATTFKIVTERRPWRDPLALARSFRDRGLGAGGFSAMSPPRRATGHVGSVDVQIAYGQPSARGRRIFPDVVPNGAVWRAGANAATEISFSADVTVDGHPVPAGSYSLWVLPGEQGDSLIINKATRVWGVAYDGEQDLLRVLLRRETLAEHVESLVYHITEQDGVGRIGLSWGDRRLSVEFAPRR